MNITVEDGVIRYKKKTLVKKFSDDTKKDLLSKTEIKTFVVFKDRHGEYPDGKIVSSDEIVTLYDYDYRKDSDGNVISCKVTKSQKKNGKSIDIEKTTENKLYDGNGRLIRVEYYTRDGICYLKKKFEYDIDGNIVSEVDKGVQTVTTKKFYRGEVALIEDMTIKSKMVHTNYQAFFDKNNRIYKVIDGDRRVQRDYEYDIDSEGNILSKTVRYFDISTTNKKLISYVVTSYNPAAGYKIDKVIKNGILTSRYIYDLKGDVIEVYKRNEDLGEMWKRVEKTTDSETGYTTYIHNIILDSKKKGRLQFTNKFVYNSDNKLIMYCEDNSKVITYEYDDQGREIYTCIKKLLCGDEELTIVQKTLTTYEDDENGNTHTTRIIKRYDKEGNVIGKRVTRDSYDETSISYEDEMMKFDKNRIEEITDDTDPDSEEDFDEDDDFEDTEIEIVED